MSRPVAVITGGARGIGLETARRLSTTHRVALLDLDGDGAHRAAAGLGGEAIAVHCDITDEASVTAAVEQVVAEAGGIDVCISNAGIATAGALRMLDPEVVAAQLEVNLIGNWRFIHACLPHVIARRGYVLGVASAAAIAPARGLGAYWPPRRASRCCSNACASRSPTSASRRRRLLRVHRHRDGARHRPHHPGFNRMREACAGPAGERSRWRAPARHRARGQHRSRVVEAPRFVAALRRLRGVLRRRRRESMRMRPRSTPSPPRWSPSAAASAAVCGRATRAPRRPRGPSPAATRSSCSSQEGCSVRVSSEAASCEACNLPKETR